MEERQYLKSHKLTMANRNSLLITGVTDVISFEPEEVMLDTEQGALIIKGEELKVKRLTIEKGEIDIDGHVNQLTYSEKIGAKKGKSVLKRMFG
ncbi:MAG: sporulation protein YabP [Eubacterium sp.]